MQKLKENRNIWVYVVLSLAFAAGVSYLAAHSRKLLQGMMLSALLGSETVVWKALLIPVVMLAYTIYVFVLFWGICKDLNTVCQRYGIGNDSPNYLVVGLLSGITLRIYYCYWMYRQGQRLYEAGGRYKVDVREKGGIYLLFVIIGLFVPGVSCVPGVFLIRNLNRLSAAYNREVSAGVKAAPAGRPGVESVTVPAPDWQENRSGEKPGAELWKRQGEAVTEAAAGCLECCAGLYEGAQVPVEAEGELFIGRDEACCNLVIKNPQISRKHCGIRFNVSDGNYLVTDYSTNGIYYKNGMRFPQREPVLCRPGTVFVIAQSGNEFLLK